MADLAPSSLVAGPDPVPDAGSSGVAKRKFAAPPVKSACLACRAARTRCDGTKPCATCQSRGRDCVYTPSRRGGPRSRKKSRVERDPWPTADKEETKPIPDDIYTMLSQEPAEPLRDPISIQNYIDPGAGLKHLEDWVLDSDFIYDSLFLNGNGLVGGNGVGPGGARHDRASPAVPMVRTYQSDAAILDAYYIFIHPFLPILPPPHTTPRDNPQVRLQNDLEVYEGAFEPSSAIALAISAVLALIPHPDDTAHQSHDAQIFRRKYAQYFAQSAFETIEDDEEIPDSATEPPKALEEPLIRPRRRQPFHPQLPVEFERIVALCILSVYEYAQRGNVKKMQNRAGQAMISAMDLALHSCQIEDEFTEARRRVWWMSYICVAQGAIVSNTKPSFIVFSPSYTAEFPTFAADPEAFSVFIQAQRAILAATQFVIELNKTVQEGGAMGPIYERMTELEIFLEPLIAHSESWMLTATTTSPVDPTEQVVARSLRCMASIKLNSARIKVHRYCAFFDIPVFSRKHCDLKSLNSTSDNMNNAADEPRQWPTCSCSTFTNPFQTAPAPASSSGSTPSAGTALSPTPSEATTAASSTSPIHNFPFSSHQSARICLKAALNIAHSFDALPYPNPTGGGGGAMLSATSSIVCPRTMPSFACCAMQCAYALLMVHQKTKNLYCYDGGGGAVVNGLLLRLQQGLTSIYKTLANYATAFEALGGMRDQIRSAVEDSATFVV